jgi:hypothetical protein
MKQRKFVYIILSAVLFLSTCSEPIDFAGELTTTVMAANKLFLEVTKVLSPAPDTTDANPGSQVVIQFDRNIDINSVNGGTVKITNVTDATTVDIQNPPFNPLNRQLVFEPSEGLAVGYFLDNHAYTIEINSVRGADGSRLQAPYFWSFRTGTAPAGSISVTDGGVTGPLAADSGFTDELSILVNVVSRNLTADRYYASLNETELTTPASIDGWENTSSTFALNMPADSTDGQ